MVASARLADHASDVTASSTRVAKDLIVNDAQASAESTGSTLHRRRRGSP
jgi:hypothetical protein